jgi:hypothetical protein
MLTCASIYLNIVGAARKYPTTIWMYQYVVKSKAKLYAFGMATV